MGDALNCFFALFQNVDAVRYEQSTGVQIGEKRTHISCLASAMVHKVEGLGSKIDRDRGQDLP